MNQRSIKGHWIWHPDTDRKDYNLYCTFRKVVQVDEQADAATTRITADTYYRLWINGAWVNDGPGRSWPDPYQYDEIDITRYLKKGENEIKVLCRYYGAGTFHRIPQQAGFRADFEIKTPKREAILVETDSSWDCSSSPAWIQSVPKVGLGMEPCEEYDARREADQWTKAIIIGTDDELPWKNLHPRDVSLLSQSPTEPIGLRSAKIVEPSWNGYTFSAVRILYPKLIEGDGTTAMAGVIVTTVPSEEDRQVRVYSYPPTEGPTILINGSIGDDNVFGLNKGENFLIALMEPWGHHNKEQGLRFESGFTPQLINPRDPSLENPWDVVPLKDLLYHEQELPCPRGNPWQRNQAKVGIQQRFQEISSSTKTKEEYLSGLAKDALDNSTNSWPMENPHWRFECREVLGDAADLLDEISKSFNDMPEYTVVEPSSKGDIEICYDMGVQRCGYFEFSIEAEAGTVVDLFAIEHIDEEDRIQHTWGNRNGIHYMCKDGVNDFLSTKRRSGRFLYLTLRNVTKPVRINKIGVIESVYPTNRIGSFTCSDAMLNRIWEICERTLRLCMEDVFTDCPLYEQTLWVGDARNEALFAMSVYDHTDIMKRCIRLAGQGLNYWPMIPSHCPTSSGEPLLPAWSFLWVISIWDFYFYTEDKEFLREVWPMVVRNFEGVEKFQDERGLFSAPFWNMFDWTPIDDGHSTVTHNSMLLKGALDAAIQCAEVLEESEYIKKLTSWKERLVKAINLLWDNDKSSYIDSIHDDGKLSSEFSIHTSFLSVLFDIVEEKSRDAVIQNALDPPEGMTRPGSPFVMLYLYGMLEKTGHYDEIIKHILTSYESMVRAEATTVWEQFDSGIAHNPDGFPTRSHSHAWSSSPIHFLNRIVLGIIPEEPGCRKYSVSPRINNQSWAQGTTASLRGPISVNWRKRPDNRVEIRIESPEDVEVVFKPNETMKGFKIVVNGEEVSQESLVDGRTV